MSQPQAEARTHYEATLDLCCEIASHTRHKRLLDRIHGWGLALMALLASSVGVAAWQDFQWLAVGLGAVLAAVSFYENAFDVAERRVKHGIQRARYLELQSRQHALTLEELDSERSRISIDDPTEYFAVQVVAQNDVLRSHGYENLVRTLDSRLDRFIAWFA